MADDIRYSKIGRHLGQQGYRHDNENDKEHTFVHPKSGHMVTVSKQEYVGGHKWTQHHGEKKVASGIGHYPELKENVLPGFLNFITESDTQDKLHGTLLHHGFYTKQGGPELSGGGKAYGHHTTTTVHTSRIGQWAIRHAGREFRGTGNDGLSAHLKGLGVYGKGMNEDSLTEKEIKVKVKAKVKIEVPDDTKVKNKGE
jgi:hypothetical protein